MKTTKPTEKDIQDLAERRTTELGYPKDQQRSGSPAQYHEQRETILDQQITNARLKLNRQYTIDAEREAAEDARKQAKQAALEDDLRARFQRQVPGGSEADFEALRPHLLAQIANERQGDDERALAEARKRVAAAL